MATGAGRVRDPGRRLVARSATARIAADELVVCCANLWGSQSWLQPAFSRPVGQTIGLRRLPEQYCVYRTVSLRQIQKVILLSVMIIAAATAALDKVQIESGAVERN